LPIFKHNSAATIAEPSLSTNAHARNRCKQAVDTNIVHNIFSLHFSSIAKPTHNPVINNDIHIMGRKIRLHNDSSALKNKDKDYKLNYTIEPPKLPIYYKKYENCLNTLPQDDDDDSNSDISTVKLESKYKEFIPDIQNKIQLKPKKKKMKRKKNKFQKQ
jgi:hypothetical protein